MGLKEYFLKRGKRPFLNAPKHSSLSEEKINFILIHTGSIMTPPPPGHTAVAGVVELLNQPNQELYFLPSSRSFLSFSCFTCRWNRLSAMLYSTSAKGDPRMPFF
jgi:hypothetical protein